VLLDDPLQTRPEPVARSGRLAWRVDPLHLHQRVVARRAGHRARGQRAAHEHPLAERRHAAREDLHHLAPAADAARAGVAARDALAEQRQVRRHAEERLRATESEPEPGHHLVVHQQRAELVAQLPNAPLVLGRRRPRAALRPDRLHQHGRRAAVGRVGDQRVAQHVLVAGEHLGGPRVRARRHPGRLQRTRAGQPHPDDQLVAPAVVAAADLHHVRVAGERPRRADRRHRAFRAGAEHPEQLHRRHQVADQFGELQLVRVGHPGRGAALGEHLRHGFQHHGVVRAEHRRAARLEQVGVLVAIGVPQVGAGAAHDLQRERLGERQVVLRTARHDLAHPFGRPLGRGAPFIEPGQVRGGPLTGHRPHGRGDQRRDPLAHQCRVRPPVHATPRSTSLGDNTSSPGRRPGRTVQTRRGQGCGRGHPSPRTRNGRSRSGTASSASSSPASASTSITW